MPIKEGYISELQALEVASSHCGRNVCLKTVTNLRNVLGAVKTDGGKYVYPRDAVMKRWPRGAYRSVSRGKEINVAMTHKGGCGELHFHACNVTINISK